MSITVVLPVYNGMKYLKQSVDSVLNQSFEQFQFLICDDCSTDNSYTFLKSFTDNRITLLRNDKNLGLFKTLNALCKKAEGTIIKLWTQDDIMDPDCLLEIQNFHYLHPEISFSYSDRDLIDEDNCLIERSFIDNTPEVISRELHDKIAFFAGSIAGNISNIAIPKSNLHLAGWFNDNMKISADFDMWVKLAAIGPVGRIAKPLIKIRDHKDQLSRSARYYILHLQEDKKVYEQLLARTAGTEKLHALWVLKRTKYVYYFSLMLYMLKRFDIDNTRLFLRELAHVDNLMALSGRWVRKRIFKQDLLQGYHPVNKF